MRRRGFGLSKTTLARRLLTHASECSLALVLTFAVSLSQAYGTERSQQVPTSTKTPDARPMSLATKDKSQNLELQVREDEEPRYWEEQDPRWFVSTKVGIGAVNTSLLTFGYGRPNWMWAGVRGKALLSLDFVSISIGPQIELLLANAYLRVRRTSAFLRHYAEKSASYENGDFEDKGQQRAQYTSLDAGLWGLIPAGPTLGLWSISGYYFPTKPDENAMFSEYLRFTLDENRALLPQFIWWWVFLKGDLMIGVAGDTVITPQRPSFFRVGPSAVVSFGNHLSFEAILTVPIKSPDNVSWFSQSWGTARLTWSWASQEPRPGFR